MLDRLDYKQSIYYTYLAFISASHQDVRLQIEDERRSHLNVCSDSLLRLLTPMNVLAVAFVARGQ